MNLFQEKIKTLHRNIRLSIYRARCNPKQTIWLFLNDLNSREKEGLTNLKILYILVLYEGRPGETLNKWRLESNKHPSSRHKRSPQLQGVELRKDILNTNKHSRSLSGASLCQSSLSGVY
ncbi:hypothetical protein NC653_030217 [Populus alba x Populus x berolinensis]|uniref:Uncharacterized protein n=1 Tax=Populus alba x Populus x berolinensis TaxID=444605 RepID=A0AAD6Q1T7_9ROSI|nr:hypothetical protein NC653_030217 [Populus alba x Populus x berolinensis]